MGKEHRGFYSMSKAKQRAIASLGGKAAHAQGKAHRFTVEEAKAAGRKGGLAAAAKKQANVEMVKQLDADYAEHTQN